MKFHDAIAKHPQANIFIELVDSYDEDLDDIPVDEIEVELVESPTLNDYSEHEYFIIRGKVVRVDGTVEDCYLNLCLPERISDYAYFLTGEGVSRKFIYEVEGDVIFGVVVECFGTYESYYSRNKPEVGIEVLKKGILVSKDGSNPSLDLAYIFRDESRYEEAIPMFLSYLDSEEGANGFMASEVSYCYREIGDIENSEKYASYS